jgi:hypothetical protein
MVADNYNSPDNILQLIVLELYVRCTFPSGQVVGPQNVSSYRESQQRLIGVWNDDKKILIKHSDTAAVRIIFLMAGCAIQEDRQCTINITLRYMHVYSNAVEMQKGFHIISVCL